MIDNRDIGVGIKVRLHKKSIGENSREALRLAIKAGEASGTPIMVHVGSTAIGMDEIADTLRPGDIITHCYTPQKPSIIDDKGKLLPLVRKAKERGVIFDVGHASGHFDFDLVERAMGEGIIPDIISSDLHGRMKQPGFGVVGDLPTTLTKFMPLGLSFDKIIADCTVDAAKAVGWQDRIGSLEVGREADIAVLQIVDDPVTLRDSVGAREIAPATHRREVDGARGGSISGQGLTQSGIHNVSIAVVCRRNRWSVENAKSIFVLWIILFAPVAGCRADALLSRQDDHDYHRQPDRRSLRHLCAHDRDAYGKAYSRQA